MGIRISFPRISPTRIFWLELTSRPERASFPSDPSIVRNWVQLELEGDGEGGISCGGVDDETIVSDVLFVARDPATRARHSSGAKEQSLVEFSKTEWQPHTKDGHCKLGKVIHCAAVCSLIEVRPRSFGASSCFAEVVTRKGV